MDPRVTPFNGRVAHISLKGLVEAERFVEGVVMQVAPDTTELFTKLPIRSMDRQALLGQEFLVLEHDPNEDYCFGMLMRDGYCGWLDHNSLIETNLSTHRVSARESYMQKKDDLKEFQLRYSIFFGSEVCVLDVGKEYSLINRFDRSWYIPNSHLSPIDQYFPNSVDAARLFLGVPYVWGGNSGRGIDCSGLVQAAYLACGVACPGDSDLQMDMAGDALEDNAPLEAGDLLFWKGHVAMATGPDAMIHANAHHMAVVEEPIEPALERIALSDTGPVTLRLRPSVD